MGRPAEHGPVVAVDVDGEVLLWCQGEVTGPKRLRLEALAAGLTGRLTRLSSDGPTVAASLEVDLGQGGSALLPVAAALIAASPGRARLIEAPSEVWAAFDDHDDDALNTDTDVVDLDPFPETVVA